MLPTFAVSRPASIGEVLAVIDEDRLPYWGGTELLLAMRMGLLRPEQLVDLKGVPELSEITVQDDQLVIGAGASHDEIATNSLVRRLVPVLAEAEQLIGNARVRAQGTIGGNLCFAEPRSDVGTILSALDGRIRLVSRSGERSLTVEEFPLGPYWTIREPEELLVDVRIPLPAPRGVYLKFQTVERPTVGVAAVSPVGDRCRLVVGAVGDLPLAVEADDYRDIDPDAIAEQVEPTPDLTGSVRYKRHATVVYVRRALRQLFGEEGA